MSFYFTYVLKSKKDNKLYIGITNDLKRRLVEHNQGKNKSTHGREPLDLIYFEGHREKHTALKREKYYKTTKGKTVLKYIIKS